MVVNKWEAISNCVSWICIVLILICLVYIMDQMFKYIPSPNKVGAIEVNNCLKICQDILENYSSLNAFNAQQCTQNCVSMVK